MVLNTRKFNYEHYTFENTTQSDWKIISSFYFGQCVTSNNIDSLKDGQFLKIYLNKSMDYKVWIHDPDFFYLSLNPYSVPKLELVYNPFVPQKIQFKNFNYTSVLHYIHQEKHIVINRPPKVGFKHRVNTLMLNYYCANYCF